MSAAVKATFDQPPAPLPRRKFVPVEAFKPVPPFVAVRTPVMLAGSVNDAGAKAPVTDRVPGMRTVSAALPRTTELLLFATAPAPTAVAKLKLPTPTFAPDPSIVFENPVEFAAPAPNPKNELSLPLAAVPAPTKCIRRTCRRENPRAADAELRSRVDRVR